MSMLPLGLCEYQLFFHHSPFERCLLGKCVDMQILHSDVCNFYRLDFKFVYMALAGSQSFSYES